MQKSRNYVGIGLVLFFGAVANAVEEHAVFKSHDSGQSWVRFDTGMPKTTRTNTFGSPIVHSEGSGSILPPCGQYRELNTVATFSPRSSCDCTVFQCESSLTEYAHS